MLSLKEVDLSACDEAGSFLQSAFWGGFKARFGWEALAFMAQWETGESKALLVLHRRLAPLFAMAYIPWGPELPPSFNDTERWKAIMELAASLKKLLPKNTAFIRFDPPWFLETRFLEGEAAPVPPPLRRAASDIQAPDTVLVDLTQSMELILAQMKPKWRYNARLALKKGVKLRRTGVEEIGVFYELLKETARRDGIAIHSMEYYQALFEEGRSPAISLYLAEHESDIIAGIVTLFRGTQAVYLYGASSDKKRNLMAPYALQLKAMEDAKEAGCQDYDLFGIPPNDDPSQPMAGLYMFKTGFGGRIVRRPGSWDYPCRPLLYRLFRVAEARRKRLMNKKKRKRDES